MTTAIDTNIISAFWNEDDALNRAAQGALEAASGQGMLVISGVVYAELLAAQGRTEAFLDQFCEETGIGVEWELEEGMWRAAGRRFKDMRRGGGSRRERNPGASWRIS